MATATANTLVLSKNSLKDTTLDSVDNTLNFQISTSGKVTSVRRWDRLAGQYIPVGDWIHHNFSKDEFQFPTGRPMKVTEFFPLTTSKFRFGTHLYVFPDVCSS